jgi:hypothetical protein
MRPASSRVLTLWISVLCLLTAMSTLASAQPPAKRKASSVVARNAHAQPQLTADTWNGAAGDNNWGTGTNWSAGVPSSSDAVTIGTTTANVNINVAATAGTLTLSKAGDSATVQNGDSLTMSGNITNNGTLNLDSTTTYTELNIDATNVTLSGTGTLNLNGTAQYGYIQATTAGQMLTNSSTITGWGTFGNGSLQISNSGTINANNNGNILYLNPYSTTAATNSGTIEATNGGQLYFYDGATWNNTGTISAAAGSAVYLDEGVVINGGTFTTTGTGWIYGDSATVENATISSGSQYEVQNGGTTTFVGTITNKGTLTLGSTSTYSEFYVNTGDTTTLTGSGTVVMGSGAQYAYFTGGTGAALVNSNNTIEGYGTIGNGVLTLTNGGTINANTSPTVINTPLYISPLGGSTFTNTGTLEATNGGTLYIEQGNSGSIVGNLVNTGATIEASGADSSGNASNVILYAGSVTGGTLTTSGAGVIYGYQGVELIGVTNSGNFNVPNGQSIQTSGTITNSGTITLNSTSTYSELNLDANTTLTGKGTVVMGAGSQYGYIQSNGGTFTLTNSNNTIEGQGNIGNGNMTFVNNGTVNANVSGTTLFIDPSGTDTNTATMEATNGGTLYLEDGTFTNTGGTITAAASSSVILYSATVNGGTLSTSGTGATAGVIYGEQGTELIGVTNSGNFNVPNGQTIYMSGTITNSGTITLNSTSTYAELDLDANTTLAGSGTIVMGAGSQYGVLGQSNGGPFTLTNSGNTIEGQGLIGNGSGVFVNNGTVNANVSGATLTIEPISGGAADVNSKTMEATNGGELQLQGGSLTNTGGTITAAASSSVVLNATTVTGGTLTTSGTGSSAGVIYGENNASLVSLTNSGNFEIQNGELTYISGTIANSGTITVDSTSTYTSLDVLANATLSGSGKVIMGAGAQYAEINGAAGLTFTNSGNTIEGEGNIGEGNLVVTNTSGSMIADVSGATLTIEPNSTGFTNNGTVEAESGAILNIDGTLTNYNGTTKTLTGGSYIANGAGSVVYLGTSGGITTLSASATEENGGLIYTGNTGTTNALSGVTSITATGALTIGGVSFTDTGNFSNAGSLTILGGEVFKVATLSQISGGSLTAGTFVLDANLQLTGATQTITTNAAKLTLAGGTIENANSTNALAGLATNSGTLTIGGTSNNVSTTATSFSNTGTLTINHGDTFTAPKLTQITGTTLSGGIFVLSGNLDLTTSGISVTTNSSTLTLEGGTINSNGVNALSALASNTKSLTIDAAVTTTASSFSNTGTLIIDKSESFTAPALTQITTTGGITTLKSGTYVLAGNLDLSATENITVNAANLTLEGGEIKTGTTNDLANLNSNTGTLTLATAAAVTTSTTANFTNTGTVNAETGTKLTVGGTSNSYNQTAGKTTVDGTLAVGTSGGVNVTGGSILGAGTITGNTTVGNASGAIATINAGDTSKAGLLTITGTYTQLATGAFTGYVSGTTADTGYSQMKVSGKATLAGTITFTVASAFQSSLKVGQTFTVLTASSITGSFTNSTIAINSTFQFDVSYTATGVVLTVADVAADNKSSQPAAAQAVAVAKKTPTSVSGLRRVGYIKGQPVAVATAHSNAILARGSELSNLRAWDHVPVMGAVPVRAVVVTEVPRVVNAIPLRTQVSASDLRLEQVHPIGVQAPLARWMGTTIERREPVKTMPMLPHVTR